MNWLQQIGGLLGQYHGAQAQQPPPSAQDDFQQVAGSMPQEELAHGISHAFRSDQTPPFPDMVGQLFQQSDPNQRAGLLNTVMRAVGPGLVQQVLGGGFGGGGVSPQQAAQVHPSQLQQLLGMAQQQNPGILDQVGGYYAQQPGLFQSLGSGAIAAALSGLAQRHQAGGPGNIAPASQDPYGDPADQRGVLDASQDPYGDPADQRGVLDASQDPYGDPADQEQGQQVLDASQDPYGDPADARR